VWVYTIIFITIFIFIFTFVFVFTFATGVLIDDVPRLERSVQIQHQRGALQRESRNQKSESRNFKLCACGPTPMLKAIGKIAEDLSLPCELSMDEHMCCGVGTCPTSAVIAARGL
jgi:hypothetical protein